jgi:hypothetical protein
MKPMRRRRQRARLTPAQFAQVAAAVPAALQLPNNTAQIDGRYDSVADFLTAVNTSARNPRNEQVRAYHAGDGHEPGFYGAGCNTGADVQKFVAHGWPRGRAMVDEFLAQIADSDLQPRDRRRRLTRADLGDAVDMGAIYAGRFQSAWTVARRREVTAAKPVTICANMICSASVSADVLLWRGVAAIALCDKLTNAGFTVRIVVGFGGQHICAGEAISCRITVKDFDMPLDVTSTSAVLLPGFFRALGHAWGVAQLAGDGKGSASLSVKQCVTEDGDVFLSHEVYDRDSALAWVNKQIAKLDGTAEPDAEAA